MMSYHHIPTETCRFCHLFPIFAEVQTALHLRRGELGLGPRWRGGADGHGAELVGRATAPAMFRGDHEGTLNVNSLLFGNDHLVP